MSQTKLTISGNGYVPCEAFCGLRDMVLKLPLEHSNFTSTSPIAVLVEIGGARAVVTLAVLEDGTTSIYFSNGGGIIGAGQHANVRTASRLLIEAMARLVDQLRLALDFPLPKRGYVRFYVLSAEESRTLELAEEQLKSGADGFCEAYELAQGVISAIRLFDTGGQPEIGQA